MIPNPWDAGSARLLALLGFEALATTSAGYAFTLGRRDNEVGRDEMLAHVAELVAATDLPVSADLENGFADEPEAVAETMRAAAAPAWSAAPSRTPPAGRAPIYPRELAVERVRAAAEVVRALPFPFMLTARAENFLRRTQGSCRHDRAPAGLPGCGRRRAVCTGLTSREDIKARGRARSTGRSTSSWDCPACG